VLLEQGLIPFTLADDELEISKYLPAIKGLN
jgi:hypothetical protein